MYMCQIYAAVCRSYCMFRYVDKQCSFTFPTAIPGLEVLQQTWHACTSLAHFSTAHQHSATLQARAALVEHVHDISATAQVSQVSGQAPANLHLTEACVRHHDDVTS